MWSLRTARRRRWSLLAAVLLTLVAAALLSGPWTPPSDPSDLTWAVGEPPAPSAAPAGRLEFYGAARNLFSSDSRSASPSPASSRPGAAASSGLHTPTSSRPGAPASSRPRVPTSPRRRADVTAASAQDVPTERPFDRFDREVERVGPGEVEPLTDAWLRERELVYASRRRRLKRACEAYQVGLADSRTERSVLPSPTNSSDGLVETVKASHFTVVPLLKTMTCLVNKAASTSLLGTFLKLTGHGVPVFDTLASPHAIAVVLHPNKRGQFELAKKHYFKFMFVRHPLERLISAYEDKVVKADHPSLHHLRKAIFTTHEDIYIRNQAFHQLRMGVANDTAVLADYDTRLAEYRAELQARDNVPTFSEFLQFVLAREPTGDTFDSHWTPYWRQCSPCHIDYDVIGTLETGADDFKYVWHRMKIYDSVKIPRMNSLKRSTASLTEHVRTYLAPVSAAIVSKLGAMFRLDFEMFGYDWEEMLRLSGHCPASGRCSLV